SRRRHTRFSRDWSSDVCSSDLAPRAHRDRAPDGYRDAARERQECAMTTIERLSLPLLLAAALGLVAGCAQPGDAHDEEHAAATEIGRASCRGSGEISGGVGH